MYIGIWTEITKASVWWGVREYCHTGTAPLPSVMLGDVEYEGVKVSWAKDTWKHLQVRRVSLCSGDHVLEVNGHASLVLSTPVILQEDILQCPINFYSLVHICK